MPAVLPLLIHFQMVATLLASLNVLATAIGVSTPLPTRFQPGAKLMELPTCVVLVVDDVVVVLVVLVLVVVVVVVVVVATVMFCVTCGAAL